MSSLDEQTHGEDLDWGEVRSACAERDWRRAWEAVGTDHEGEATPGEVYILSAARRAWSVAPALRHWRAERDVAYDKHIKQRLRSAQAWREIAPLDKGAMWRRIKRLAGMESSAAAQHGTDPREAQMQAAYERNRDEVLRREWSQSVGGVAATNPAPRGPAQRKRRGR